MYVINRINLPKTEDTVSLYLECGAGIEIDLDRESEKIDFTQGGMVSTNSYFNSFYESYYAKYTNLDCLYYLLRLEGDFQVSIYRELEGVQRQLVGQEALKQCQLMDGVKLALPALQQALLLKVEFI